MHTHNTPQSLLRLSLGSGGPGMSPEALQSHSLPSSVSDALEAMVGGGLDDLTLEDIEPSTIAEEQQQQQSEVRGNCFTVCLFVVLGNHSKEFAYEWLQCGSG